MSEGAEMWAQIKTGEFSVTFSLPGSYNPDTFDDMTTRLVATFQKAITIVTLEYPDEESAEEAVAELPPEVEFADGNDE